MKKLKKTLSLTLALALSLAMAVPAFADYTDPSQEEVNFSVDPIGVATISGDDEDARGPYSVTAYVFDQNCVVTRKDGQALTMFRFYYGMGGGPVAEGEDAVFYVVWNEDEVDWHNDIYWFLTDDGEESTPNMISKDYLDWLTANKDVKDITAVEFKPMAAVQPEQPAVGTAYVVSAKQGLNVRTGPGTNYPKARAALTRNTAVQVVEVQGQWGKLANDAGWVFMPGLKAVSVPTTPTTPETPEQTFPITMVVNNSKGALNVRTGPGTNYKIATTSLRNGSVITIDKIEGQWGRLANYMDWWVYLPGAKTVKG